MKNFTSHFDGGIGGVDGGIGEFDGVEIRGEMAQIDGVKDHG